MARPLRQPKVKRDKYAYSPVLAKQAMDYFIKKGMAPHQAAGLVGNLLRESRLNHTAHYNDSTGGAYGIAQWRGARQKGLFNRYGNNPTLQNQLDYVWWELNNTHKKGYQNILNSKTAEEAARYGMGGFEFSASPEGAIADMIKHGQDGYGSMADGINFAKRLYSTYEPAATYEPQPYAQPYQPKTVLKVPTMQYHEQPVSQGTGALLQRNTEPDRMSFFERLSSRSAARKNQLLDMYGALNQ